jgi:hypothetical protein
MFKVLNEQVGVVILAILALFMVSGCNQQATSSIGGNGVNQSSAYFGGKQLPQDTPPALSVKWTVDGKELNSDIPPPSNAPSLSDMGWHILTLAVVNQDTPLATPIPLLGVQSQFYPNPTDNKGESIELIDINCKDAQFSKNGDTCSVYMRVSYNYEKAGIKNPPLMYVQFAPVNYRNLPILYALNVEPLLDRSQGEYREILPIETFGGSTVTANRQQYIILQMQNIALEPLNITTISNLTNPNITLMHRASAESNDPYYADKGECSLTANSGLNQINRLESFNDACILVYQTITSTTKTVESDVVTLATDAYMTSPWSFISNDIHLVATYVQGQPIPTTFKSGAEFAVVSGKGHVVGDKMVMDSSGSLWSGLINPSTNPFNLVDVSYTYIPGTKLYAQDNVPGYSNGVLNIDEVCHYIGPFLNIEDCSSPVGNGSQIITSYSNSNPVTIGNTLEKVNPEYSESKSVSVDSCGGARTDGRIWLTTDVDAAKRDVIHLHADAGAPIHCGGWETRNLDIDVPVNGTVYQNGFFGGDDQGCGGGHWDMGGNASVSGSCNGNTCSYRLDVSSSHGGDSGQCHVNNSNTIVVSIPKPRIYQQLSNLQNFNYSGTISSNVVGALAGQNLSAAFGGQSSLLAQTTNCDFDKLGNPQCKINGVYQNGTSDTAMQFQAGNLLTGDALVDAQINYNRSDGYDLANFAVIR